MSRMNSNTRKIFYPQLVQRDGEQCKKCGKLGNSKTLVIDHLDNDNSNNKPSNLQLLCRSCNGKKNPRGKGKKQSHVCICGNEYEPMKKPSPELKKHEEKLPIFEEWLMINMLKRGKMSVSDILNAGAEKTKSSQITINRYLACASSFEGKYEGFEEDGQKYVKFKPECEALIRKEEATKNKTPENVLQLPKQAAINETG